MNYYAIYHFLFPIHEAFVFEFKHFLYKDIRLIDTNTFINQQFEKNSVLIFLVSYTVQKDNPKYLSKIKSEKTRGNKIIFYNDIELNMHDVYNKHIIKKNIYKLYDQIWSYDDSHRNLIDNINVPFYYIPYGYSLFYETFDTSNIRLEYDFLFFGRTSKYGHYRKKQLEILRNNGLNIKIVTDKYGDDLIHEIAKAKIILNIKSGEDIIDLDFPRYSLLVGMNKFFLTDLYHDKSGVEDHLKSVFKSQFCKDRFDMIKKAKHYLAFSINDLQQEISVGYNAYKKSYGNYLQPLKTNQFF